MKEIMAKIQTILETPILENDDRSPSPEAIDSQIANEYGEQYTDLYVLVRNINDFFGEEANPKALELVDSFLLESLVLLKKNHDIIRVESGDDYVKATAYTPEADTAGYLFDSAVQINTMLELYNKALAENEMTRMDAGIGLATFAGHSELEEGAEAHSGHECHCGECECEEDADCECEHGDCECGHGECECGHGECECEHDECECGHEDCDCDHEGCDCGQGLSALEFAYATDFSNTAMELASIANRDELDPIVINESLYSLMTDSEVLKDFLDRNLEKVIFEGEDFSIFHGNIVSDEE